MQQTPVIDSRLSGPSPPTGARQGGRRWQPGQRRPPARGAPRREAAGSASGPSGMDNNTWDAGCLLSGSDQNHTELPNNMGFIAFGIISCLFS